MCLAPVVATATAPRRALKPPGPAVVLSNLHAGLHRGDAGPAVLALQLRLRANGQRYVVADGGYGALTQRAVTVLERKYRMKPTGVAKVAFLRKLGLNVIIESVAHTSPAATPAAAPPPATRYLRHFPIVSTAAVPYSTALYPYTDAFGTPGPVGAVQGANLPAAMGSEVVAVCNATVIAVNPLATATALGGAFVELQDVYGNQYWYEHLSSTNVAPGAVVTTGQKIGAVGNSGDAVSGAPYLYVEVDPGSGSGASVIPGGGGPVDPFGDLRLLVPPSATG